MDPDATLARIRKLVADYNGAVDERDAENETVKDYEHYEDALLAVVEELPGLVEALDQWLADGGGLPAAWVGPRL